jgi:hypothetical protein
VLDEAFFLSLETHLARVTRSVEQDAEFLAAFAKIAASESKFAPMFQHFFTISQNQAEALVDLTSDIGELTRFGAKLIGLLRTSET